jgi:hypothetical protein
MEPGTEEIKEAIAEPSNVYTLDERDQKAMREVQANIDQLRLSLADAAYDEAMANAKKIQIVLQIEKAQIEGRRIISEGAKAKGIDLKNDIEYNADNFQLTVKES